MSRAERQQTVRLKLLALVLALALTWYSVNPAPGPSVRLAPRRDDADEEPGEVRPAAPARSTHADDIDDLEWPEVIDV